MSCSGNSRQPPASSPACHCKVLPFISEHRTAADIPSPPFSNVSTQPQIFSGGVWSWGSCCSLLTSCHCIQFKVPNIRLHGILCHLYHQGLICYELRMKVNPIRPAAVAHWQVASFPLFAYVVPCEYGSWAGPLFLSDVLGDYQVSQSSINSTQDGQRAGQGGSTSTELLSSRDMDFSHSLHTGACTLETSLISAFNKGMGVGKKERMSHNPK